MLALERDFFSSPPRKTVRFGGTVTEVLLKYKKVREKTDEAWFLWVRVANRFIATIDAHDP